MSEGPGFKMEMQGEGQVTQPWEKQGMTEAAWREQQNEPEKEKTDDGTQS